MPAIRHPLDLRSLGSSKNYEDSVRRRYEMEQQVAKKDNTAKRLMMESDLSLTLVKYLNNLVGCKLLAAARGNDGAVGYGADGVIVENDAHFGESGRQTYFADEVGKKVNALVGILYQPYFLRPTTELFFCALVDMSIEDWV